MLLVLGWLGGSFLGRYLGARFMLAVMGGIFVERCQFGIKVGGMRRVIFRRWKKVGICKIKCGEFNLLCELFV